MSGISAIATWVRAMDSMAVWNTSSGVVGRRMEERRAPAALAADWTDAWVARIARSLASNPSLRATL